MFPAGAAKLAGMKVLLIALFAVALATQAEAVARPDDPVFLPGVVSTKAAEVRLAVSPDGRQMLWGSIGRDGPAEQQDVWERHRTAQGWSAPARMSFDTEAAEFDPAFSPDGRKIYFHSDRPGGFGGTDIYVAARDPKTFQVSAPRNLGSRINSAGDEWAPTPTRRGTLIFASDGWGGAGRHDLFEVDPDAAGGKPVGLGPTINGPDEDFDAALTRDGRTLVFSSGTMDGDDARVGLYSSTRGPNGFSARRKLRVGCSAFVIGASFAPGGDDFYYAANCSGGRAGWTSVGAPI